MNDTVFRECDVLTVEIEHVDVTSLTDIHNRIGKPVHPAPSTLAIIQVDVWVALYNFWLFEG